MPKYGDIIKQAKSVKPDSQTARQPEVPPPNQTPPARSTSVPASLKPDNQTTRQPDEPMKNLCVKVPESWRRHWAAQAKLTGRTMTDVMVEALTGAFGLPDNQQAR
jgi:hypothetical protein